jgi:hypothetical protein
MGHGTKTEDVWSQGGSMTNALLSELIMTHLSTDIRVLLALYNLCLDIIGGQRYIKTSTIMSKDVPNVRETKSTTHPICALLQPIYPKPEALPFETIALDFITKLPESEGK